MTGAGVLASLASPRAETPAEMIAPVVYGGSSGLELRWWVLDDALDASGAVARAVGGCSDGVAALAFRAERVWLQNGFRVARVPLAELPSFRACLPLVGTIERRWFGQALWWTEALRGAAGADGQLLLHGAPFDAAAGATRMLVRAWSVPTPEGGARLRTELALQRLPDDHRQQRLAAAMGLSRARAVEAQGRVFASLSLGLELEDGYAYVLVPAPLEERWSSEPDRRGRYAQDGYGPFVPRPRTLGETLLMTPRGAGGGSMRAVVVLIPRVGDRFTLLR